MRRLTHSFAHLGAALAVVVGTSLAQAGATVSLATNGHDTARLICSGSIVLNEVYYLRLMLSDGVLLISWRENLRSGTPDKVLILTNFGQCQAQETGVPFSSTGTFNSH